MLTSLLATFLAFALLAAMQEDLACISVGMLAASGDVPLAPAMLGCIAGTITADFAWIFAGRFVGRWALQSPPVNWLVRDEHVELCTLWLSRAAPLAIIMSRFLPGMRTPLQVAIGTLRLDLRRVAVYLVPASAIYVTTVTLAAALLGTAVKDLLARFQVAAPFVLVVLAVVLWAGLKALEHLTSGRIRARLGRPAAETNSTESS